MCGEVRKMYKRKRNLNHIAVKIGKRLLLPNKLIFWRHFSLTRITFNLKLIKINHITRLLFYKKKNDFTDICFVSKTEYKYIELSLCSFSEGGTHRAISYVLLFNGFLNSWSLEHRFNMKSGYQVTLPGFI